MATEIIQTGTPTEGVTSVGSYFISNYPPFSFWKPEYVPAIQERLDRAGNPETPLGIYLHIPFCRKRCHFCYFRVYTDKNAEEIRAYLTSMMRELELATAKAVFAGRKPRFVYFGGGTPSYLSERQLELVVQGIGRCLPLDALEEMTFECEPGTLSERKLQTIRDIGVTRLSLGIENFDDTILEQNGRAHRSREIARAYDFARSIEFPQINIDLIAGMMGETDANWRQCVEKAIAMEPDSVTVYQMEIPFNTTIYHEMKAEGKTVAPVADWDTKRRWVKEAFECFEREGYVVSSAYTVVRHPEKTRFLYRDLLWTGADLLGIGVASFSHVAGMHFQNQKDFGPYLGRLDSGCLPIHRGMILTDEDRVIRELILQLKLGHVSKSYFRNKFGVAIEERFAEPFDSIDKDGRLVRDGDWIGVNREGLLRIDELLHRFFRSVHRGARYT